MHLHESLCKYWSSVTLVVEIEMTDVISTCSNCNKFISRVGILSFMTLKTLKNAWKYTHQNIKVSK